MRIKIRPSLLAGALALTLVPASYSAAQSGSQQQQARVRLEQSARNVKSELSGKTGGAQRQQLMREQRQIEDAIKKLQAGQRVSTEEIDQILGEVSFERAK